MAKNILQEAIADAKRVKSAALANAKIALEETFQPTIQRMISSRLQTEDDEVETDDMFAEEDEVEIDVNPAAEEEGEVGMASFDAPAPEEEEETAPDMELEALIRELEGEEEFVEEGEEEQFQSTNPSSEKDQFQFENDEATDDEVIESVLEALLGEEEGLGDDLDMGQNKEDGTTYTDHTLPSGPQFLENRKLRNEVKKLKKDLQEAFRTITTYKQAINEVNLLNAKLMFTTKTLRQFELNENQQVRVLESFDRAKSVREVKLVYTTIVESFNKKAPIKENKGLASKTVKQINPNAKRKAQETAIIAENTVSRLQELAGLKRVKY